MELQGVRKKVFEDRYAAKDEHGNLLEHNPQEMWSRVARTIAKVEATEELKNKAEKDFYEAMEDFKFIPGGRILSGAGVLGQRTFYNCFVIPSPEDSREGIMKSVSTMAEIMARGGGVGVNISSLRPKGSYVKGVNGTASGAVSFGGLYSYVTGLIIQGGSRRGALMLMLNDDHPDIEEFITIKRKMGLVTNANLSVCVSDKFMEAVKADAAWDLIWKGEVIKTIKARYLWDLICESAWASGEPGLFFIERANKQSNSWYCEELICTNPCGEQPLGPWGVCNLGAINFSAFVENGEVDWASLAKTTRQAVHMLDNVIDSTEYFFSENHEAQMGIRRIGIGTLGLGDALIKLKVRYGSDEAVEICKKLYSVVRDEAYRESVELSKTKGAFPKFDAQKYSEGYFIKKLPQDVREGIKKHGIRNCFLLTQAPTGSTGLLSGASSGLEPIYDFIIIRKDRLGEHEILHPLYEKYMEENPGEELPSYFVTAKQLAPEEHIKMQAVIQEYIDSSISKTVNAPNKHTIDDVKELYIKGYDMGCKGLTYYRDGSRDTAVLYSKDDVKKEKKEDDQSIPQFNITPKPRPEMVSGSTYKIKTGYGTLFVTVNNGEDGRPFEVFATIGKTGGFFAAKSEAICRLISLALRSGIDAELVLEQLSGIRGPMPSWSKYGQVLSIPDAIAHVLRGHINSAQKKLNFDANKNEEFVEELEEKQIKNLPGAGMDVEAANELKFGVYAKVSVANRGFAPECPECHSILELSEGCMLCRGCGYSKCG